MSEANLFQRGDIWWLRATVNGVELRESLRTRDVKAARKIRDKKLEQHRAVAYHGAVSWLDAVSQWAEHALGVIGPKTAKRYAVSLKQCRPWLEGKNVAQIDGKLIADMSSARARAGATHATIRRDLTAVSRVLEYAEGRGWREGNPTLSKRHLFKERRDPIALPDPLEVETFIAAASSKFGALIRAAWLTGCRQDELVNLTWRQFNARSQTLEVIGKGNKRRTLQLSALASAHFSAHPRVLGSDLIFCRESGDAFAEAASDFCHVRRALEARAKKEKRPFRRFRFHDLRHLFAVETLRNRTMDIYKLSLHLGHTSVKTTEIYLEFLTPDEALAAKHG